jgi:hypothetical protein
MATATGEGNNALAIECAPGEGHRMDSSQGEMMNGSPMMETSAGGAAEPDRPLA